MTDANAPHPIYSMFSVKEVHENPLIRCFNPNLPPHLMVAAQPFIDAAVFVVRNLPSNAERTTCLRKLREAKDCAVTSLLIAQQIADEAPKN